MSTEQRIEDIDSLLGEASFQPGPPKEGKNVQARAKKAAQEAGMVAGMAAGLQREATALQKRILSDVSHGKNYGALVNDLMKFEAALSKLRKQMPRLG